jgi:hypothetical protein
VGLRSDIDVIDLPAFNGITEHVLGAGKGRLR